MSAPPYFSTAFRLHPTAASIGSPLLPCRLPLPASPRCARHRRICNRDILSRVQQVICFAFHDSRLLLETCSEAKEMRKIVTLFYLD